MMKSKPSESKQCLIVTESTSFIGDYMLHILDENSESNTHKRMKDSCKNLKFAPVVDQNKYLD